MRHTKEPWSARINETVTIRDGQDNQIGILTHLHTKSGGRRDADEVAANARRIVACVNACAGLDTGMLENVAMTGGLVERFALLNQTEGQRDELLCLLGVHPAENAMELAAKASKDLHMASMQINELLAALKETTKLLAEYVVEVGGCDHSVGICYCGDRITLANAHAAIAKAEAGNA